MRNDIPRGFIGKLACVALLACASGQARATTLDYQGYAFDTGGDPIGGTGDTLRIPVVVVATSLGADLGTTEITGWIDGLVSTGLQDGGDGTVFFTYSPGTVEFFRDPARDHDFGTAPPNATVPGTFRNGEACLTGELTDFVLYFDPDTGAGAYEGNVRFTDGACLGELGAGSAEGFTFGGVLSADVSGSVPAGYLLAVDGYLEAQKKPLAECPFTCFALSYARLDFPRRAPHRFGPKDGKFVIEGGFAPCADFGTLDPSALEVRVRIGDYVQVFPEGSLAADRDNDDDDGEWEYRNRGGTATITELEIEQQDGRWEFEIHGRGIERATLLPNGSRLEVELTLGTMNGTDAAVVVQKKSHLRFRGDECPCRTRDDDDDDARPAPAQGEPRIVLQPAAQLLGATPNPFNATTVIRLHTERAGDVSVRIFDARGRAVRVLHAGGLPAGEQRFVWDGRDGRGVPVPSGIFLYRVEAPGIAATRKLVVAK